MFGVKKKEPGRTIWGEKKRTHGTTQQNAAGKSLRGKKNPKWQSPDCGGKGELSARGEGKAGRSPIIRKRLLVYNRGKQTTNGRREKESAVLKPLCQCRGAKERSTGRGLAGMVKRETKRNDAMKSWGGPRTPLQVCGIIVGSQRNSVEKAANKNGVESKGGSQEKRGGESQEALVGYATDWSTTKHQPEHRRDGPADTGEG